MAGYLLIYNFFLTILLIFLFPIISSKVKIEQIKKEYKVWIHCASLGEVKIALKLIENIVKKLRIPQSDILLTTTTLIAKKVAQNVHKDTYLFPPDYYFISRRFIRKINPKMLIILETELWPNYVYLVKKYSGKIIVVNGRISHRTFVLLNTFRCIFSPLLKNIDLFLVREKIDYIRFKNLGVKQNKIIITGNMKYDDIDTSLEVCFDRQKLGLAKDDFVVSFGSVREGEEKYVIKIVNKFKENKNLKFIIAPRHLSLIKKIVSLLKKNNIKYEFLSNKNLNEYQCLIVDTYGVLKKIYSISDIVFVCGTILPYGGQNIIEPAILGKMVVFGPHIANFLEPATVLLSNNAAVQLRRNVVDEFESIIRKCLQDKNILIQYGNKAKYVIKTMQGVTEKNIDIIAKFLTI